MNGSNAGATSSTVCPCQRQGLPCVPHRPTCSRAVMITEKKKGESQRHAASTRTTKTASSAGKPLILAPKQMSTRLQVSCAG